MQIQIAELEVLDSKTHKYASSTYSGGGMDGSGRAIPVTSHTTHHSDQTIWVRNAGTEQDLEMTFATFNIGVRPGHCLLALEADESPKMFERLYNLTTGERSNCNGEFNEGSTFSGTQRIVVTLFGTALAAVAYLQYVGVPLIILLMLLSWFGKGSRVLKRLSSRQRLTFIMLALMQLISSMPIPYFLYAISGGLIELFPLLLPIAFLIYTYYTIGKYNELIRARSMEIDRTLDDVIAKKKAGNSVSTAILVPTGNNRAAWRVR